MAGNIIEVTDANFQAEVIESETPVLVDFWAPWCGPCRVVAPVLEEIALERDDLRIVKLNVDENQQTAANYQVLSIPTMILFKDGAGGQEGHRGLPQEAPRGRARARSWPSACAAAAIPRPPRPRRRRASVARAVALVEAEALLARAAARARSGSPSAVGATRAVGAQHAVRSVPPRAG